MKKAPKIILILLVMNISFAAVAADNINELSYGGVVRAFRYQHDPRLNNKAMDDIIINPDAVYGFSPSPTGSLAAYEEYDRTAAGAVETYRQNRI